MKSISRPGFKRGKDAFIPANKRYAVYVEASPSVVVNPESPTR